MVKLEGSRLVEAKNMPGAAASSSSSVLPVRAPSFKHVALAPQLQTSAPLLSKPAVLSPQIRTPGGQVLHRNMHVFRCESARQRLMLQDTRQIPSAAESGLQLPKQVSS